MLARVDRQGLTEAGRDGESAPTTTVHVRGGEPRSPASGCGACLANPTGLAAGGWWTGRQKGHATALEEVGPERPRW
jgi:hypothetical protein